jgi:arylsulfatase A-like enzyme
MGHPHAVTPALDDMAAGGLVFNRFYAAAPVCSPTRGSALTGRHPFRYGIYFANTGHLPEEEPNLASLMKAAGYRTGHFGKWHLGTMTTEVKDANRGRPGNETNFAPPWERGFDVAFSTESKVPTYNPLWRPRDFNDHPGNLRSWWDPVIDQGNVMPYGTHYWNERAESVTLNVEGPNSKVIMDRMLRFVDDSVERGEPFFAVVWFHEPHLPVVASESDREPFTELDPYDQHYWGCIKAMDREIGRMREHLRTLDIHEKTMVWFTSDNGPEGDMTHPGSAGGLRGRKRDLYEGGIRVPGIVEWPGTVQVGKTDFAAVTSDYLPTLVDLLGIELDGRHAFDGVSLMPVLKDPRSERETPIGFMSEGRIAWIGQRFKVIDHQGGGHTWAEPPWNLELYDLVADPSESKDLAAERPELLDEMGEGLRSWYEGVRNGGSRLGRPMPRS